MEKTILEQAFTLFSYKDKNRIQYESPFEQNGFIYQTDMQSMIFCSKENVDFKWSNEKQASCADMNRIVPEANMNKKLFLYSESLDFYRTEDDYDIIRPRKDCEECDGNGCVTWEYESKTDGSFSDDFDCPVCDGTGGIDAITKPNGKKKFPNDLYFKIGSSHFSAFMINKLEIISKLFSEDVYLISQNEAAKANLFSIGYVNVLLMPVTYPRDWCQAIEIGNQLTFN